MKKKNFALISMLLALSIFAGCGGGSAKVRDDVAVSEVSAAVLEAIGDNALVSIPDTYLAGAMKMDASLFDTYDVKINSMGANIDEYGVFKAKDASQVAAVEQAVKNYIQMRKDTWMVEYMPEERPKLDSAEVKTLGNYVMYAILSDEGKTAAFGAFEKSLKA